MSTQLAKKIEDTLSKIGALKGDVMLREVRDDLLKAGITDKMLNDAGFIEAKPLSGIGLIQSSEFPVEFLNLKKIKEMAAQFKSGPEVGE